VPCATGICPEVYLEKAFRGVGNTLGHRLAEAKTVGENTVQFQVHPTLLKSTLVKWGGIISDLFGRVIR
jgi:hypothetical protein